MDTYRIVYHNGTVQTRRLVFHSDWQYYHNKVQFFANLPDNAQNRVLLEQAKREMKQNVGDNYFTDKSPVWDAISTGILNLPSQQGGSLSDRTSIQRQDHGQRPIPDGCIHGGKRNPYSRRGKRRPRPASAETDHRLRLAQEAPLAAWSQTGLR